MPLAQMVQTTLFPVRYIKATVLSGYESRTSGAKAMQTLRGADSRMDSLL
jgi:hypothetical protein